MAKKLSKEELQVIKDRDKAKKQKATNQEAVKK
jgi:hypothetical protein